MKLYLLNYYCAFVMFGLTTALYLKDNPYSIVFLLAGLVNVAAYLRLKKRNL